MSPNLGSSQMDRNGPIEEKKGNTPVASLRKVYGLDFLRDWSGDAKLSTVRKVTDMSLTELVRQHQRGKM